MLLLPYYWCKFNKNIINVFWELDRIIMFIIRPSSLQDMADILKFVSNKLTKAKLYIFI